LDELGLWATVRCLDQPPFEIDVRLPMDSEARRVELGAGASEARNRFGPWAPTLVLAAIDERLRVGFRLVVDPLLRSPPRESTLIDSRGRVRKRAVASAAALLGASSLEIGRDAIVLDGVAATPLHLARFATTAFGADAALLFGLEPSD